VRGRVLYLGPLSGSTGDVYHFCIGNRQRLGHLGPCITYMSCNIAVARRSGVTSRGEWLIDRMIWPYAEVQ